MPYRRLISLSCALAALFVAGCTPQPVKTPLNGERTLVEASADRVPDWVVKEPASDAEYHYFRGIRTDAPTLEAGETDARQNAMASIVQFLGLRVTVDYQRMRTEKQTEIRDALRSVGGADIFGTRLSELFYRRWRVREGDEVTDRYDVYVLIRFPRASVERFKQDQEERLRNIQRMLAGPPGRSGEIYGQITGAAQALTAVDDLNQSVLVTAETEGQAEDLRRQANARLTKLIGGLHLDISPSDPQIVSGHLEKPFTIGVSVTLDDGGISPAPNTPVDVSFGDSTQVVWTNQDGVAAWDIYDITPPAGARNITAKLELPESLRSNQDFMRSVPTASATVEVIPRTRAIKLLLLVSERIGGQPTDRDYAETRLMKELTRVGFTVIASDQIPDSVQTDRIASDESAARLLARQLGATMVLCGTVEAEQGQQVRYGGSVFNLFFSTASVQLVLVDVSSGNVVTSITLPNDTIQDTRGGAGSPGKAAQEALTLSHRGEPDGYRYIADTIRSAVER